MPSRIAQSNLWTANDRQAARSSMESHAAAESQCVRVSGDSVSFDKNCFKQAVPKGSNKQLWTE